MTGSEGVEFDGTASREHAALREAQQAYVREILAKTGWSMRRLAEEAKIATASLPRFLNNKLYTGLLSTATLAKLHKASGVSPPAAIMGAPAPAGTEVEPVYTDDPIVASIRHAAPNALLLLQRSDVMAAAGLAMGDILVIDTSLPPAAGDIVLADIAEDGQRQIVTRLYYAPYLVAAPLDALTRGTSRRPLLIDNDRVRVSGVVTDIIRKNRRST